MAVQLARYLNKWGDARYARLAKSNIPGIFGGVTVFADGVLLVDAINNNQPWGKHAYNVGLGAVGMFGVHGAAAVLFIGSYVSAGIYLNNMVNWINTTGERMVFNQMFNGKW